MLVAIISDIHANIDALEATLDALDRLAVDQIYCTGDIVGYGAAPAECIALLRNRKIPCACGNHDSYVIHPEQYSKRHIRAEASKVIEWTRGQLTQNEKEWLADLPLFIETEHFTITHASCQPYPTWMYVTNQRAACMHLLFQQRSLCFTGHSHIPTLATHSPGHRLHFGLFQDMVLPSKQIIMVGVGAIGQPRDDDSRACAILYDTVARSVTMLRVKYDIFSAQRRILHNNLPHTLAIRLSYGK